MPVQCASSLFSMRNDLSVLAAGTGLHEIYIVYARLRNALRIIVRIQLSGIAEFAIWHLRPALHVVATFNPFLRRECDLFREKCYGTGNMNKIVRGRAEGGLSALAGKVYRRRFVSTRLAATLLADGAPCFAICACPALVIKRDCSYISIHFSLEIAEISLPIASSGKSSGDSK